MYGSMYNDTEHHSALRKFIVVGLAIAFLVASAFIMSVSASASTVSDDSPRFNCWLHGNKKCGRPPAGQVLTRDGKYVSIKAATRNPSRATAHPRPKPKAKASKSKTPVWLAKRIRPVPAGARQQLHLPKTCVMILGDTSVIICPDGRVFTS